MTDFKRIEVVRLLKMLKREGEKPGDVILRALRAKARREERKACRALERK